MSTSDWLENQIKTRSNDQAQDQNTNPRIQTAIEPKETESQKKICRPRGNPIVKSQRLIRAINFESLA